MTANRAAKVELTDEERKELESLGRSHRTALARRARIVLAEGLTNKETRLKMATVGKWRRRFAERRLDSLHDEPRPGAPHDDVADVIRRTETPPGATHWSLRSMAGAVGYAPSNVHRIWRAFCLKPRRSETFKLSKDPLFVEKVRDIVSLYLDPPERAIVLSVDEKSQMQALDRTRPLLCPGQVKRRIRDAQRHDLSIRSPRRRYRQGEVLPPPSGIPQVFQLR